MHVIGYLLGKLIRPSPMVCLWKDIVWLTICRVSMSWLVLVCYFVEGYPDCVVHHDITVTYLELIASTWPLIAILGPQMATGRFFAVQFSGSIIMANRSDILNQFFGITYFCWHVQATLCPFVCHCSCRSTMRGMRS